MYILQKGKFKVSASNDATMKNYLKDGWKVVKSAKDTDNAAQNSQGENENGTSGATENTSTDNK